jgi:hypothetical protein
MRPLHIINTTLQADKTSIACQCILKSPSISIDAPSMYAKILKKTRNSDITKSSQCLSIRRSESPLRMAAKNSFNYLKVSNYRCLRPIRVKDDKYYNPFTIEFAKRDVMNGRCLEQYKTKIGDPGQITMIRLTRS